MVKKENNKIAFVFRRRKRIGVFLAAQYMDANIRNNMEMMKPNKRFCFVFSDQLPGCLFILPDEKGLNTDDFP